MNRRSSVTKAGFYAGLFLLLQSCLAAPQTELLTSAELYIPAAHEIADVPFYPQEQFYCGPTTLAEVLGFYGIDVVPDDVAPSLFIPEKQGSLQIEMVSSIRQYGLLAYAAQGDLSTLLSLVSDNQPVIVFQNLGTSWYPRWHYAVVIGYNLNEETILLHTGVTERRAAPMGLFERTWKKGQYWMLAAMPSEQSSEYLDPFLYVSAAQDLINVNQEEAGINALETASHQWEDYWLSYFLLGNLYLERAPEKALHWYEKGLDVAADNPAYLNNYAYALHRTGLHEKAIDTLKRALSLAPDDSQIKSSLEDIRNNSTL